MSAPEAGAHSRREARERDLSIQLSIIHDQFRGPFLAFMSYALW
jgi:hypothetical protein